MKKLIKRLIGLIVLAVIVASSAVWYTGYKEYTKLIEESSVQSKMDEVRAYKHYVPYDTIPTFFLDATVAVEDERFYSRNLPIDVQAILRATWVNIKSLSLEQGGSTIPQQVAKNLYLDNSTSFVKKVTEYYLTKDVLKELSKQEILTTYVNIIYYGNGGYGVQHASRNYFELNVWELNEGELSILAGLPQAPSVYDLTQNFDLARQRQKHVLYRLEQSGKINKETADNIFKEEIKGYE